MNGARVETRHHQWRDWRIRLRIWKVRESGSLLIQLVSWCYLEVAMKVVGLVCEEHTDVINSKSIDNIHVTSQSQFNNLVSRS